LTPSLTLLTLEAALVLEAKDVIDSFELARFSPLGGNPGPEECTMQAPGLCLDGDLLTLEMGAKSPKCGRHSKYLFPSTEPSFFPLGSSSSTPTHSPGAKSVRPMYLTVPILEPWVLLMITRSPILKSTCVALEVRLVFELLRDTGDFNRLLVLPVGEIGLLLTPLLGGVIASPEPIPGCSSGTLVRRVSRENTPFLFSHWKYLVPATEPSFLPEIPRFTPDQTLECQNLPIGSSSAMPAQSPGAN
jgi:hypothetical protein